MAIVGPTLADGAGASGAVDSGRGMMAGGAANRAGGRAALGRGGSSWGNGGRGWATAGASSGPQGVTGVETGRGARLGRRLKPAQGARANRSGRVSGAQRQAGQKVAHP
jgi:hypothetical protein